MSFQTVLSPAISNTVIFKSLHYKEERHILLIDEQDMDHILGF